MAIKPKKIIDKIQPEVNNYSKLFGENYKNLIAETQAKTSTEAQAKVKELFKKVEVKNDELFDELVTLNQPEQQPEEEQEHILFVGWFLFEVMSNDEIKKYNEKGIEWEQIAFNRVIENNNWQNKKISYNGMTYTGNK